MVTGIYKIVNLITGQVYIGSADNCEQRWETHKKLRPNNHFDNHVKKYGIENFEFEIIDDLSFLDKYYSDIHERRSIMRRIENHYIIEHQSLSPKYGYNKCFAIWNIDQIESMDFTNKSPSEKHRKNLSKALKGKEPPNKGKKTGPRPYEVRQKISQNCKGKNLGPKSDIHRENLSKALKGRKIGPMSDEGKRIRSEIWKNKSDEEKESINKRRSETMKETLKQKQGGIKK